ncbi:hypothetical protein SIID45300_00352 [Candidatus Magnetaquicoccaceae bacterium FCR-1]|uniref:Uncharacterized protein n=1 Tax=Candidatus Magnetaquiglobus chichijimensis TaxID=3141448 RepID=A0ABQ0C599_9PROT
MDRKQNCWEFFNCGRSRHAPDQDGSFCPVSLIGAYDGINGGRDAGRACWNIEGTFCSFSACGTGDDQRGTFDFKKAQCQKCAFKALVIQEEGETFQEKKRFD